MKAGEFRIGNLVKRVNVDNDVRRIVGLDDSRGSVEHIHIGIPSSEFGVWDDEVVEGIPITTEWLLRFGFIFDDSKSFSEYFNKSHGNIKSYVNEISHVWFCSHFDWMCHQEEITSERGWCVGRRNTNQRYEGWNYNYSAEVEYVHQLQNLYFALTGTELTIK